MLNHLLAFESEPLPVAASAFVALPDATPAQILDAKANAAAFLDAENPPDVDPALERARAQEAFAGLTGIDPRLSEENVKERVLAMRTPEAVKKTVQMLTAYEWEFVEQAKNIRSYIVNGLLEETKDKKPEVRLKAYKMLGEVTEVALFTQRTEIVTKNLSEEQIEAEIKKRIEKFTIDAPLLERVDSEVDDE